MIRQSALGLSVLGLAALLLAGITASELLATDQANAKSKKPEEKPAKERSLKVQYLEIVTPSVDETCKAMARAHDVVFSKPVAELGNARTADLKDGGRIGVRAPMRKTETPIVRPYVLVDDIGAAVKAANDAGAILALPPTEIPGQGTFAIYILGGIEHGLWQL
jgi:predicted enzyme related to lactoylglutathione lyase